MSADENKALVRRFFEEIWNNKNIDVADQLIADDHINHDPASPMEVRGPDGFKQLARMYIAAHPDLRFTIEDQIAEGDMVVTRWTASGTQQGPLMGLPPTGKHATVSGIQTDRIAGGKLQESWVNWDTLGMLQQIGAVPAAAPAETG